MYTDVSYYTTWILDTIADAEQEEAYSKQPVRSCIIKKKKKIILKGLKKHKFLVDMSAKAPPRALGLET